MQQHDDGRQYHTEGGYVHAGNDVDHERLWQLTKPDLSLAHVWYAIHRHHFQGRAAASTVEAIMLGLRERGTAALKETPVRRRIGELSEPQLREVVSRLQTLKPEIAKPWTADQIDSLLQTWDAIHG